MIDCPQCQAAVDGAVCPVCKYRDPAAGPDPAQATSRVSKVDRLCVHVERGQRCAKLGTITPNIHGPADGKGPHPGPWFCSDHMPGLAPPVVGPRPANFAYPRGMGEQAKPNPPIEGAFKRLSLEDVVERLAIQSEGRGGQDRPT